MDELTFKETSKRDLSVSASAVWAFLVSVSTAPGLGAFINCMYVCVCVFPYMQGMCTSLFSLYRLKSFVSLIITLIDLFNLIEHYLLLMHVTLVTSVFVFFMLYVCLNKHCWNSHTAALLLFLFPPQRHKFSFHN